MVVLPRPKLESPLGVTTGFHVRGMMVRVIRFQSSFRWKGTTGCTLSTSWVPFNGPNPKLVLLWKGTLIRSATEFCSFFARSVLLSVCPLSGPTVVPGEPDWAKEHPGQRKRAASRMREAIADGR